VNWGWVPLIRYVGGFGEGWLEVAVPRGFARIQCSPWARSVLLALVPAA
jgi:hypothetical protein